MYKIALWDSSFLRIGRPLRYCKGLDGICFREGTLSGIFVRSVIVFRQIWFYMRFALFLLYCNKIVKWTIC